MGYQIIMTLDDFLKTKMLSVFSGINIYLNGELVLSGVDVYTIALNSKYGIYKSYVVITAQENHSELSIFLGFQSKSKRAKMKFSEYIKQLNRYAPNNIVSINYKNNSFLYKDKENNDYDNLNVTGDGFIKIKEYLDWNVVGVEVFLSDNDENHTNCFVLDMLNMKHMAELKSKQNELKAWSEYNAYLEEREKELNQKAQQELDEYNALRKHKKEQWLELFLWILVFLLVIGVPWLLF